MSDKTYGIALIGAGVIAPTHANAIAALPNAKLVAVCDTVREKADEMAAKYGAEPCYSIDDVLRRPDVDVVDVVVWSGRHAEMGVKGAEAGKHVFVTKPIDVTLEAIDSLIEACDRNQRKLGVVHQFRSYLSYKAAKQAVSSGAMGKMVVGNAFVPWFRAQSYYDGDEWRGTWKWDGGGALMNQGVHYVDLLQWIMGGVKEIFAYADISAHHERIEVEDIAVAALRFNDGSLGSLQASTSTYKGMPATMDIHGRKGNISITSDSISYWDVEGVPQPAEEGAVETGGSSDPKAALRDRGVRGHAEQIGEFLKAIETNGQPMIDGREARKAVEINLAIYKSAREKRPVTLPL